jgi:predicted small lipoprotein YifL
MFVRHKTRTVALLILILLAGCGQVAPLATSLPPTASATSTPVSIIAGATAPVPAGSARPAAGSATPEAGPSPGGLSAEQVATLSSLEKVDGYPLYTMRYVGDYPLESGRLPAVELPGPTLPWACSLFATLAGDQEQVYGRNFDWQFSPALLLFTDPPGGYASVSMVDIAYLGFEGPRAGALIDLPLAERASLLESPHWPFDGMNEHGLAVGMAAVPQGGMAPDPARPTLGSLGIMRHMLDHTRTVDEAINVFEEYNVAWNGGPPLHYLLSDRSGRAMLVEFYQGKMVLLPNEEPWHLATNFLRSAVSSAPGESAAGNCWRYDRIEDALSQAGGYLSSGEALDLLAQVAQHNTQWSVVYGQRSGEIVVTMGQKYGEAHAFHLPLARQP